MKDTRAKNKLISLVNASGFLFQLGVEEQIAQTTTEHGWSIIAREHTWSSEDGSGGFIDMVALRDGEVLCLVIECKRVKEGNWVFLVPGDSREEQARIRVLWTQTGRDTCCISGWHDFRMMPSTFESQFCVVRGSGESEPSFLERHVSRLLQSVRSLANEELEIHRDSSLHRRVYLPLVVTNADLHVCHVDLSRVSMETGQLEECEFSSVPLIRFRKTLETDALMDQPVADIADSSRKRERTILVARASDLSDTLKSLIFPPLGTHERAPWVVEIERLQREKPKKERPSN